MVLLKARVSVYVLSIFPSLQVLDVNADLACLVKKGRPPGCFSIKYSFHPRRSAGCKNLEFRIYLAEKQTELVFV